MFHYIPKCCGKAAGNLVSGPHSIAKAKKHRSSAQVLPPTIPSEGGHLSQGPPVLYECERYPRFSGSCASARWVIAPHGLLGTGRLTASDQRRTHRGTMTGDQKWHGSRQRELNSLFSMWSQKTGLNGPIAECRQVLGDLDGDAAVRAIIEEQDRLIAKRSGIPAIAVKSIHRSPSKKPTRPCVRRDTRQHRIDDSELFHG